VLTSGKRALFAGPKLVVAGMARRLEVVYDPGGLALGVQVYAASEITIDPHFLIGLLNSKLMSFLFSIRYQAKHLSSGYLTINKGQLQELPIRTIDRECRADLDMHDRVVALVERIMQAIDRRPTDAASQLIELDSTIDHLVYELYGVTADEVGKIERSVVDWRWLAKGKSATDEHG
jgi:hypothetical protein